MSNGLTRTLANGVKIPGEHTPFLSSFIFHHTDLSVQLLDSVPSLMREPRARPTRLPSMH